MFIDKYSEEFGINWLLRKFEMSPNAYYNYKKKRKNAKLKEKEKVKKTISAIYHTHNGVAGYRMMKVLLEQKGIKLSLQTVRKYMNVELGLKSVTRKKKRPRSKSGSSDNYRIFDNLINQKFIANSRNTRWAVDFTYLYLARGQKRYNCTIIDLYDRRVVATKTGSKINAKLAIDTVKEALGRHKITDELIIHSDRGSKFTSKAFVEYCKGEKITQSMSKPGCPYDNAPMERFFNTLKTELINIHRYETEEQLSSSIICYSYGWYNNLRPHSFNDGLAPLKAA